jgi:hypothetical protein
MEFVSSKLDIFADSPQSSEPKETPLFLKEILVPVICHRHGFFLPVDCNVAHNLYYAE